MSKYNVGDKFVLEIDMLDEDDNLPTIYQSLNLQGIAFSDTSLDNLERLDSDYINEHYGELQDEAYAAGLKDGQNEVLKWNSQNENYSYKEGFTDALSIMEKLINAPSEAREHLMYILGELERE